MTDAELEALAARAREAFPNATQVQRDGAIVRVWMGERRADVWAGVSFDGWIARLDGGGFYIAPDPLDAIRAAVTAALEANRRESEALRAWLPEGVPQTPVTLGGEHATALAANDSHKTAPMCGKED